MLPKRDEAIGQLERVLASEVFASTSRLSRFLRFVAERSLAGESDRLKEYVIGVEVFDRDTTYDPRIDSIVRVEAGRLRTKLEQYYLGVGRDDEIVIRLRKGSYAATFESRAAGLAAVPLAPPPVIPAASAAPPAAVPVLASAPRPRRTARLLGVSLAVLLLVAVAATVVDRGRAPGPPPANAIAVLPFEPYQGTAADDVLAMRLTEGVTAELVRSGRFSVVPSRSAREAMAGGTADTIARRLRASWLLEARVVHDAAALRVEARLVNANRNRKFWVETFSGSAADLDELVRRVAAGAAQVQLPEEDR
jgi:TolB-like protein